MGSFGLEQQRKVEGSNQEVDSPLQDSRITVHFLNEIKTNFDMYVDTQVKPAEEHYFDVAM
jgi:hypothetical protein